MTDQITLTGNVASVPRHLVTSEGLAITSFRLGSTQRRFDRAKGAWVNGDTNWYTVSAFRQLALHTSASVAIGDPVIVTGRLKLRKWDNSEKSGISVDVEADSIGHDLTWGQATFTRSPAPDSAAGTVAVDPDGQAGLEPVGARGGNATGDDFTPTTDGAGWGSAG